jgi:hypothetical protein
MSVQWKPSPTGYTASYKNKACTLLAQPGGLQGYSLSIEGIEKSSLPNLGAVRNHKEANQAIEQILGKAERAHERQPTAESKSTSPSTNNGTRYGPHPREIRLRLVEIAASMLGTEIDPHRVVESLMGGNTRPLEAQLTFIKEVVGQLEPYVFAAEWPIRPKYETPTALPHSGA